MLLCWTFEVRRGMPLLWAFSGRIAKSELRLVQGYGVQSLYAGNWSASPDTELNQISTFVCAKVYVLEVCIIRACMRANKQTIGEFFLERWWTKCFGNLYLLRNYIWSLSLSSSCLFTHHHLQHFSAFLCEFVVISFPKGHTEQTHFGEDFFVLFWELQQTNWCGQQSTKHLD